jgi:hypothetical protein
MKIRDQKIKRIHRFLKDETGLIFGLTFVKDKFHFLVKNNFSRGIFTAKA